VSGVPGRDQLRAGQHGYPELHMQGRTRKGRRSRVHAVPTQFLQYHRGRGHMRGVPCQLGDACQRFVHSRIVRVQVRFLLQQHRLGVLPVSGGHVQGRNGSASVHCVWSKPELGRGQRSRKRMRLCSRVLRQQGHGMRSVSSRVVQRLYRPRQLHPLPLEIVVGACQRRLDRLHVYRGCRGSGWGGV
jgi:hypothetical protein